MNKSKRYLTLQEKVDRNKSYSLKEGIDLVKEMATAKFDESVELSLRLGVDPRKADQMVRGTVSLPNGTGKEIRVLVLTKGPKAEEAKEAGADYVGFEEYIEKINNGWLEMDAVIATPDGMKEIGKLGKVLGPRGLMPNPKSGTVTMEVGEAVREVKAGRIEFRVDKYGILHMNVGKASFEANKLSENIKAFMDTIIRLKPSSAKGQYLRNIHICSSMSPGIRLDRNSVLAELR